MKTILRQVEAIEQEAAQKIARAREESQATIEKITSGESTVLEQVQSQAHRRADAIIKEATGQAKSEAAQLIEEEGRATQAITETANKNRAVAINKVIELLTP